MGAYKRGEGRTFFHVSGGKLKKATGKKDEKGKAIYEDLDGYEGRLTAIEKFKDEYEGKPQNKIRITMVDDKTGEVADITVTDNTFFIPAFFARLENVEIDQPFLLGVLPSEQNDKMSFCFLKQYGKKIEKNPDFPKPEKIDTGGGQIVYKWTAVGMAVDSIIEQINGFLKASNPEESKDVPEEGWPQE